MPGIDLLVIATILLSFAAGAVLFRRRGVRGRRSALALVTLFHGVVLVWTMTAHCLDVASRLLIGKAYDGRPFPYDFRAYALLLLGGLLLAHGVALCRTALALSRRQWLSTAGVLRRLLVGLGVVAPLVPVHAIFAVPLTALALLSLAAWVGLRRSVIRPAVSGSGEPALSLARRVPA